MRRALPSPLAFALFPIATALAACGGHTSSSSPASADATGQPPSTPATVSCSSFASPSATPAMRKTLYETLVARTWTYPYCGNTDCTTLALDPSGSYSLSVPAGYAYNGSTAPRDDSGHWNFAAIDDGSGVVCFDGAVAGATHVGGQENLPSVLHFKLTTSYGGGGSSGSSSGPALQIGPYTFQGKAGTTPSSLPTEILPSVTVSAGFAALIGATWKKTNTFDTTTTPDTLVFDQSGGFTAVYGGGMCPRSGSISYDRDTMLPQEDSVTGCAATPYNYGPGFQNAMVPGFFDDLLVLGTGTYRKSDAVAGKPNAFVFDPYGHSVRVYGTYDGALKAGAATTISLTFENTDPTLTRTLGTFSATMQPATVSYGQAQTAGKLVPVGTVDLGGATLAPGAKTYATVTVTPPAAGDTFAFAMRVSFTDVTKKYDGGHTFLTAIAP